MPFSRFLNSIVFLSRSASLRRASANSLPGVIEALEFRMLLSGVMDDGENEGGHGEHCGCCACGGQGHHHDHHGHEALFDSFGNEYDVLTTLPDPTLAENSETSGTGDFDGSGLFADLSQTFQLHSNPGAAHTIYLDFDGHTTTGTSWNSSFNNGAAIVTPAFSFQGDASFTDAELARIQEIWQRVSEDFLPFDVNVTTQDPGAAALSRNGGGDSQWGIRVLIGGNGSWYSSGVGGVAYISSFNWSSDTPTFVFEDNLGNGHGKFTAEAVSHEVGHTLGLHHDGTSSVSYYRGHGSGSGWAPIMGVGYYEELSQWSSGEYAGANNTQDDLAIITTQNGFGYRADLVGNTAGSASTLGASGTTIEDFGVIEDRNDVDVYTFLSGAGAIEIQGLVANFGPNLDLKLELFNESGQLIASADPTNDLDASLNVTVAGGRYFLHVSGVGQGDVQGTGYSDYGSIGSYRLEGTLVEPSEPLIAYFTIQATNADQNEGDSGTTAFTFTVHRTGDTSRVQSLNFAVTGGSANASDFPGEALPSGTVDFAAGEASKTITIQVAGDATVENDESFTVTISGAGVDAEILTASVGGNIRNDDVFSPQILNRYALASGPGLESLVQIFNDQGDLESQITPYGGFMGGVRVATGDVNGDGVSDVITAPGPGGGPHIKVYDGVTGEILHDFFAFATGFRGGVYAAAGDFNGDGKDDIAIGADAGGGPHVRVFSGADGSELHSLFAYSGSFTGGVRVATGDVNGDGFDDLITAKGPGDEPLINVFDGSTGDEIHSFYAYAPAFRGGVYVASADLDADGRAEIVVSADAGGGPHVRVFRGADFSELFGFFAYSTSFTGGVRVGTGDINSDGTPDIITTPGPGGGPHVKLFDGSGEGELQGFFAFNNSFTGGIYVAGSSSLEFGQISAIEAAPGISSNTSSVGAASDGSVFRVEGLGERDAVTDRDESNNEISQTESDVLHQLLLEIEQDFADPSENDNDNAIDPAEFPISPEALAILKETAEIFSGDGLMDDLLEIL